METTGRTAPTNGRVAALLREYADLLELSGESAFRLQAFRRAADQLSTLDRVVAGLTPEELQQIPGIGRGIAATIAEIARRGTFGALDELRATMPASVMQFTALSGIGVKTAAKLYQALGVTTLDELRAAAEAGRIGATSGLGARLERQVRDGFAGLDPERDRLSIGIALPLATLLTALLTRQVSCRIAVVGSIRRGRETVGDIDLLAASPDPAPLLAAYTSLPPVVGVVARAADAATVELDRGVRATLTVVPPERFGTDLVQYTGAPAHLAALQAVAGNDIFTRGYATEDAFYAALGLPVIPPELREGHGEVEAASAGRLPTLLTLDDIRGDVHAHSTWSDGKNSIAEMAQAALARGYDYLSISDHSRSLAIANGLTPERLREQWREIDRLNAELAPFRLLKSCEVEIKRDGSLDLPDEVLAQLDLVIASLHSGLRDGREAVTARLVHAMRNPHVDIIAHPTGRIVGGRAGADYDWETVYRTAAETSTALEINASPERLDLRDEQAHAALARGITLSLGSDAHEVGGLAALGYGVATARRAWAMPAQVLNTRGVADLLASR